jgi:membrane protein YqaA with SNARE-associated domain
VKLFAPLLETTLRWSRHPHAPWYLGVLSFAESSFFPIPPDVMLAPMVLARPERAWWLAGLTTLASVIGGIAGFALGLWAIDLILPLIERWGYADAYAAASTWFARWGFWAVLAAGFSPIPYKVFTIAAGGMFMPFAPFVMASALGRASRFFLVAGLLRWGGERLEAMLQRYVELLGWAFVAVLVVAYLLLR